jgi:Flp pilus assembly protein TadG
VIRPRSRLGRRRGQALVEFALVLPIALLVILAVFDVGRAVFIYNGLTNAAREGARLAIVNQDESLIARRVQDMAVGTAVENIGDADLVAFRREEIDTSDGRPTGTTTGEDCAPIKTGCVAVVIARTQWQAITPIIGSLLGPLTLEARAELVIEFVCPNPNIAAYNDVTSCPRQP